MTREEFNDLLPGDTVIVTMWNNKEFRCKVIDVNLAVGKAFVFGPNVMYEHATPDMLEFVERNSRLKKSLENEDYKAIIEDLQTRLAKAGDYNEANKRLTNSIFTIYKACNGVLDLISGDDNDK